MAAFAFTPLVRSGACKLVACDRPALGGHNQLPYGFIEGATGLPRRGVDEAPGGCASNALAATSVAPALLGLAVRRRVVRRRRIALCATRHDKEAGIKKAIAIGKKLELQRNKEKNLLKKKQIRKLEIQNKITVLKGGLGERYRREQDISEGRTATDKEGEQEASADEADEAPEGEEGGETEAVISLQDEAPEGEEGGETVISLQEATEGAGYSAWVFNRYDSEMPRRERRPKIDKGIITKNSKLVAATELEGDGNRATAAQLIDAAANYRDAHDYDTSTQLFELARKRIDMEQIQRTLTLQQAQDLDLKVRWALATTYEANLRFAASQAAYAGLLKLDLALEQKTKAYDSWVDMCFEVGQKQFDVELFDECLQTMEELEASTKRRPSSKVLTTEVILWQSMALQRLNRIPEAKLLLSKLLKNAKGNFKNRVRFCLEVMSVETSGERQTVFNEVFEQSLNAEGGVLRNRSTYKSQGAAGVAGANLTPREREWKQWASEYWESRLKSPLYYAFLVLWVTWPFAIPVIAILNPKH